MDLIYLCGIFNDYMLKTLWLYKRSKIKIPLVIAPMGSFSKGAYQLKKRKKTLYVRLLKILRLTHNVTWSVTSSIEKQDLIDLLPNSNPIFVAEDLPRLYLSHLPAMNETINHKLNIVFVSRITEKKNLDYAISCLMNVRHPVSFTVYGHIEDKAYWEKCKQLLEKLPSHITWRYEGSIHSESILDVFSTYDVFLFPTKSENYGHVIYESLASGCIPVISDQTPWLDLNLYNAGFIYSLDRPEQFTNIINQLAVMPVQEVSLIKQSAYRYAKDKYHHTYQHSGYKTLFNTLLKGGIDE
jgi:glycosyltransferase involved in cell wall biosynthesis